ncbi:MAG: hypothetical protein AB8G96_02330 [Phycisphaerales bacterium]
MRESRPEADASLSTRPAAGSPSSGATSSDPAGSVPRGASLDGQPSPDSPWARRLSRPAIVLGSALAFVVAAQTFEPDWSRADDSVNFAPLPSPTAGSPIAPTGSGPGLPIVAPTDAATFSDGGLSLGQLEDRFGSTLIIGGPDGPRWLELDADGRPLPGRDVASPSPPSALRDAVAGPPVLLMRADPSW